MNMFASVSTSVLAFLYVAYCIQFAFDYNDGDIYACVADIGWITGHSYVVYGPLSNGATTVLFESTPTYPDPGMAQTVKVLILNERNILNSVYQ